MSGQSNSLVPTAQLWESNLVYRYMKREEALIEAYHNPEFNPVMTVPTLCEVMAALRKDGHSEPRLRDFLARLTEEDFDILVHCPFEALEFSKLQSDFAKADVKVSMARLWNATMCFIYGMPIATTQRQAYAPILTDPKHFVKWHVPPDPT